MAQTFPNTTSQWEQEWERVLWKKKPYPDNYVPRTRFLEFLKTNDNFERPHYGRLVIAALAIPQHIATIFVFISVFIRIKEQSLDPRMLIWMVVLTFLIGYISWEVLSPPQEQRTRTRVIKSSILVFLALLALSPVLRTLTEATASDSIWALAAFLFLLHTLLADYTSPSPQETKERLTSVLSMNAAISSSVVLASRLDSNLAVFALVLFAVQCFALFPILRRKLQLAHPAVRVLITCVLAGLAIFLIQHHSSVVSYIVTWTIIFINILCPALLVWAQRYKNEIRGPWDVAVPHVK